MNSIGPLNAAAAPVETAVPAAVNRVDAQLGDVESLVRSLEARLTSVLEPENEGSTSAGLPPAHPVPLAATLHEFADRAAAVADRVESLLKRLHV